MINDYEATKPMTVDAIPVYPATTPNEAVISTLNGLIQTCKDGEEGFRDAAEGVKEASLKTSLYEHSLERSRFSGELQEMVRWLGGDPEKSGSLMGVIHRGWMEIKAAVSASDNSSILSECERGEDAAKKNYLAAIDEPLPDNVLDLVKSQFATISHTHDWVKALRDNAAEAAERKADAKATASAKP